MTYRGHIKNGVVVLEGNPALKEGTLVEVEPVDSANQSRRGSAQAIARAIESGARWQGTEQELDRLLHDLKQSKQAELNAQNNEETDRKRDNL